MNPFQIVCVGLFVFASGFLFGFARALELSGNNRDELQRQLEACKLKRERLAEKVAELREAAAKETRMP